MGVLSALFRHPYRNRLRYTEVISFVCICVCVFVWVFASPVGIVEKEEGKGVEREWREM